MDELVLADTLANVRSLPNTPAGDSWVLYVGYTQEGTIDEQLIPITFLPNGDIDNSTTSDQTLESANNLLSETISYIRSIAQDSTFDIWQLLNWIIVSYYWIFLYDFGQTEPTYYQYTVLGLPNFTEPVRYSSTNNIFVNNTLFITYSSYLRNVIFPMMRLHEPGFLLLPQFLALDDHNSLQSTGTSFLRSYSCVQRQLKNWVSVIISVLVADYALIIGAYSLVVWCAGKWQKYNNPNGNYLI